ncbi:MAG: sigma 54-interacting transcriptional regulator [Deltaproteobacteria bacterium]
MTIGRAPENEIRIDDTSISRQHAVLQLSPLRVTDLGSANGTWVREQRLTPQTGAELSPNEPFRVGGVTLVVQRRALRAAPARRVRSFEYFETRLEDQCATPGSGFVVLHVVADQAKALDLLANHLRAHDLVGEYAPNELAVLVLDVDPRQGLELVAELERALGARQIAARIGSAWYPRDGRDSSSLAAHARSRARGELAFASEEDVVVEDPRMAALHALVRRVAKADISVLLQGETGVGKEVIAELIHRHSDRASAPFLRLNCAAIAETLLESELFGHERGAFTGAVATKPGLLEVADGGVVFLDEVGELTQATQAKLLRVLDERKLTRVGGVTPRAIDVRIVSATNRDLDVEVTRGTFRLDLMYRLNAMAIVIPPLRERVAEIEPLARQVARTISAKAGTEPPRFTEAALEMLRRYAWPGNVRELRNMVERAMVLCANNTIEVIDLPYDKMRVGQSTPATIAVAPEPDGASTERERILAALETCHGHQTNAARLLGISRRTLINRLEKFALPRPRKR